MNFCLQSESFQTRCSQMLTCAAELLGQFVLLHGKPGHNIHHHCLISHLIHNPIQYERASLEVSPTETRRDQC